MPRATPPALAPAEEGRMNAADERANSVIRVLSPRIAPAPRFEAGSTASTAIRRPRAIPSSPKRSMKVDLPAPGGPEMPMRTAPPVCGSSASTSRSASSRWSDRVDSTSVTARASARRSPRRKAAVSSSMLTPGVNPRRVRLRAPPPPAGGPTSRHRRRRAPAARDGGRARRFGHCRARESRRPRRSSTAGAQ